MVSPFFYLVPSVLLLLSRKKTGISTVLTGHPTIDSLPPEHGPDREALLLTEIERKAKEKDWTADDIVWTVVQQDFGDYIVSVPVMADSLKIGGVRINTTFETAQKISDVLGVYLLTPHLSDLIEAQSGIHIEPCTHSDWMEKGTGSTTRHMIEHSREVDERIAGSALRPGHNPALVNNPGKIWVNTSRNWEKKGYGANYGWYSKAAHNGIMWQGPIPGLRHTIDHVDYSQVYRALGPIVTFQSRTVPADSYGLKTETVFAMPNMKHLIVGTDEGLKTLRHPDIPPYPSVMV